MYVLHQNRKSEVFVQLHRIRRCWILSGGWWKFDGLVFEEKEKERNLPNLEIEWFHKKVPEKIRLPNSLHPQTGKLGIQKLPFKLFYITVVAKCLRISLENQHYPEKLNTFRILKITDSLTFSGATRSLTIWLGHSLFHHYISQELQMTVHVVIDLR